MNSIFERFSPVFASDTSGAAAPATTTVAVKEKVTRQSKKEFVDASGVEVAQELAIGLKYTSINDGKEGKSIILDLTKMDPALTVGSPGMMLALFGLTTLATNHASFNRNTAKGDDQYADDTDAVVERVGRIVQGDWGGKAGGGGFAIDLDVLAAAAEKFAGRPIPDLAAWKAKMEAEPVTRRNLRQHSAIAPIYDEMMRAKRAGGKPEADVTTVLGF